jgi:hypothetical protein
VLVLAKGEDVTMQRIALVLGLCWRRHGRRRGRRRRRGRFALALFRVVVLLRVLVLVLLVRLGLLLLLRPVRLALLEDVPVGLDLRDLLRAQAGLGRIVGHARREASIGEVSIAGVKEVDGVLGREAGRARLVADEAGASGPGRLYGEVGSDQDL